MYMYMVVVITFSSFVEHAQKLSQNVNFGCGATFRAAHPFFDVIHSTG